MLSIFKKILICFTFILPSTQIQSKQNTQAKVDPSSNTYQFMTHDGKSCEIKLVTDDTQIDKHAAREILANSFITEYKKYLQPNEIDTKLKVWRINDGADSVEQYYFDYFAKEIEELKHNKIFWIEAKIDNKLVGWTTFAKSATADTYYMDLLIVDPNHQSHGIGKELVFSAHKLHLIKNAKAITLLLRKKNQGGRTFYSKLNFKPSNNIVQDNFVDQSLLEGLSLEIS